MSRGEAFLDTSVLLYLYSGDDRRAEQVESLLMVEPTISVQVLNEFASVATRKLGLQLAEAQEALRAIRSLCKVVPLTVDIHDRGLAIAARYGFSVYDSMIVSAALEAGCDRLLTEDLQHGQRIDASLTVRNPFVH